MAYAQILLHWLTAEIKKAMAQADRFSGIFIVELKWQRLRAIQ